MTKELRRLLRTLLGIAVLVTCVGHPRFAEAVQEGRRSVTVLVPQPGSLQLLAFWVALGGGYFNREGLDVRVISPESPAQARSRFLGGAAPVALLAGPDYERLVADRAPVIVAANLLQGEPLELVMRREVAERLNASAAPVRRRLEVLRGVSVGVSVPDRSRLYELFRSQNLDANLARIVVRKGDELLADFASGQLDAIYVASPFMEKALVDHDGVIYVDTSAGEVPELSDRMVQAVVAHSSFVSEHPDDLKAMVRALGKAEHDVHFDLATAVASVAQAFPQSNRKQIARLVATYARAVPATPHVEALLIKREARFYPVGGDLLDLTGVDLDSYALADVQGAAGGRSGGRGAKASSAGAPPRLPLALVGALVLLIALLVVLADQRERATDRPQA